MKKINYKKIIPGFISLLIVAGMAMQSFATNVDFAAFVDRDKYMTAYYEIDWSIEELDKRIERMYKFTCTNVKSFAGTSYPTSAFPYWNYYSNYNSGYPYYNYYVASIDQDKYLRVNKPYTLFYTTNIYNANKVQTLQKDIPASLCKWKDGIELYPETKVTITMTRNIRSANTVDNTIEMIMGPFKKFPRYTAYGSRDGKIFDSTMAVSTFNFGSGSTVYYATDTRTKPTSWPSTTTTYPYLTTTYRGNSDNLYPDVTSSDELKDLLETGEERITNTFYFADTFSLDLSAKKDIWLRFYLSNSSINGAPGQAAMYDYTITSWNYDK